MPVPLELLYQLTPRDQVGVLWRPFFFQTGLIANAAATHVHTMPRRPQDDLLFITESWARVTPTLVRIASGMMISVADQAGNQISTLLLETPFSPLPGAGDNLFRRQRHDIAIVGGQMDLVATFTFDAGAAGNSSEFGVMGYTIPRGNVALP